MVKRKVQPVCAVSVELTSDLAEYGKEESAESTLYVGGTLSLPLSLCVLCGLYVSSFLCGW